jgi:hypothetical protein
MNQTFYDPAMEQLRDRTIKINIPHLKAWLIKDALSEEDKDFMERVGSMPVDYMPRRKPFRISVEVE